MTPGGQAIIVLPDGQVSYTAAHSGAVPPGSLGGGGAAAGWVNATLVSDCEPGEGVEVVTWREPGTFRRLLKEREMGAENGDDDDEDHDDYDKHDEGHDGEDYKENESDDDDSRSPYENSTVHGQPKRPSKTAIPSSHKLRKRGGAGGIFVCSGDWMSDSAASKGATGAMYAGRDGFDGADDDRCRLIEGLVQAWTNRPYGAYQYL